MKIQRLLISHLVLLISLTACGSIVKKVNYAPGIEIPADAHPAPLKWSGVELLLPPGMNIGQERSGVWCSAPAYPVNRATLNGVIDRKFLRQTFHDAMEANGYDIVASLDLIDEVARDDVERAEYSIKGKIKDIRVDMCHSPASSSILGGWTWFDPAPNPGTKGELYAAIDWTVWDPVRRTVVYKTRTEGYTDRPLPNMEGLTLMFHDAFEMATHNLASDPEFFDLVVRGIKPQNVSQSALEDRRTQKWENRPRKFDPLETVTLHERPLSRQPFKKWAEEGRRAAVMIQKFGHGSGVFITKEGHILTNAHVVGDGMRTRIVTPDRTHKIPAEILRIDKTRDVALLKLEKIPEDLDITTLPVRPEWPDIGEDIYAVGTPRDWHLMTDTVTKGIVSAHRRDYRLQGRRQNYIQGDVEIHGGNSGGPLLDEYGNLVGLSVAGLTIPDTNKTGMGLNHFIPIEEALQTLDIKYIKHD